MRNKKGFTLVEVLVTLAIIGILTALLIPAINAARQAAKESHEVKTTTSISSHVKHIPFREWQHPQVYTIVIDGYKYIIIDDSNGVAICPTVTQKAERE